MFLKKEPSCGEAICGHGHQLYGIACSPRKVEFRPSKKSTTAHQQASSRAEANKSRSSTPGSFQQPSTRPATVGRSANLFQTPLVPHKSASLSSSVLHEGKSIQDVPKCVCSLRRYVKERHSVICQSKLR